LTQRIEFFLRLRLPTPGVVRGRSRLRVDRPGFLADGTSRGELIANVRRRSGAGGGLLESRDNRSLGGEIGFGLVRLCLGLLEKGEETGVLRFRSGEGGGYGVGTLQFLLPLLQRFNLLDQRTRIDLQFGGALAAARVPELDAPSEIGGGDAGGIVSEGTMERRFAGKFAGLLFGTVRRPGHDEAIASATD